MTIQKQLFNEIKKRINSDLRLVDVVSELLAIGTDSCYRRLRGSKELSITELSKLCTHFNISFDLLNEMKSDSIPFKYTNLNHDNFEEYELYMEQFAGMFNGMLLHKEKEFIIAAKDIPLYHFMPFAELTYFKVYAWQVSMGGDAISFEQFVSQLRKEKILKYYEDISNCYLQIPSTEIWSYRTIEPIVNLIKYYNDINRFEDETTIALLCSQLLELIDNLESYAKNGMKKFKGKTVDFNLYLSPVDVHNDFALCKNDLVSTSTIKLFTINSITSTDPDYFKDTEDWIRSIASKSELISKTSERERFRFIKHLRNMINKLMVSDNVEV